MLKVQCLLCKAQTPTKLTELTSKVIARNEEEELFLVSQEMAQHCVMSHSKDMEHIAQTMAQWSTIMLLRHFDVCLSPEVQPIEKRFEKEKEDLRTRLAEELMLNAPEELEDDELEEEDEEEHDEDCECDDCLVEEDYEDDEDEDEEEDDLDNEEDLEKEEETV